jgi:4,5-DOPA dioxygenase extradiol
MRKGATGVGIHERPKTIHDFGGFPQALFDVEYPAPGHPELAGEVASMIKQTTVIPTRQWGLEHGTWTVLKHMYPRPTLRRSKAVHGCPQRSRGARREQRCP